MPNHIHGVIALDDITVGTGLKPAPTKRHGFSEIVRAFKTFSARHIKAAKNIKGIPFWQQNYYEHIIRNERAYIAIRDYIFNNPVNWKVDILHPNAPSNRFNRYWR